MRRVNLVILRVSPSSRLSVHVIQSENANGQWVFLCSYQGHMRLAQPPSDKAAEALTLLPQTLTKPLGWKTLMEFASPCVSIDHKVVERCPHCQEPRVRLPLGVDGALLGRPMLLTDNELTQFKAEKPWTRQEASEFGSDSIEAWEYEQGTPLLDAMPVLSPSSKSKLEVVLRLIPDEESPFCTTRWGEIAKAMDLYIGSLGDLQTALQAYACTWGKHGLLLL